MTEDEMRAALAETAEAWWSGEIRTRSIADALLPTVRRIVAEELRAAADGFDYVEEALGGAHYVRTELNARADALDPR